MVPRGGGKRRWRLVRARRDAVPTSVRRLSFLPRPRLRLRLPHPGRRPVTLGLVAAVLLGALAGIVYATPLLSVRVVEVRGSTIAAPDQVRQVAAVTLGTPLARVDTDAVRARVRGLAPVADAIVHRSWPSTLVIDVTERRAVAAAPAGEQFLLVDGHAVPYQTVARRPPGLALLKVPAPAAADPATRAAVRVLVALTPALRGKVDAVVADSPTRLRLELAGGRTVVWGDAENSDTKARVATALLGQPGRTIDVSAPDVATVS